MPQSPVTACRSPRRWMPPAALLIVAAIAQAQPVPQRTAPPPPPSRQLPQPTVVPPPPIGGQIGNCGRGGLCSSNGGPRPNVGGPQEPMLPAPAARPIATNKLTLQQQCQTECASNDARCKSACLSKYQVPAPAR